MVSPCSQFYKLLSIIILISEIGKDFVKSEPHSNTSRSFRGIENDILFSTMKRLPKLLTFHTLDQDIKVDFEFKVPFVQIPVKRTHETVNGLAKGLVNINLPSILLSGLVVALGAGVGKYLQSSFYYNPASFYFNNKEARLDEEFNYSVPFKLNYKNSKGQSSGIGLTDLMDDIENMFRANNVDTIACVQKAICSIIKKSLDNVESGVGTSTNKIIDGFSSSKWILSFIEGTAIKEAIDSAKDNTNCTVKYNLCKWTENQISSLINSYLSLL